MILFKTIKESVSNNAEDKVLSYDDLMAFAFKHYNKGGDSVYECWDKQTFNDYVEEFGPITEQSALRMFGMYDEVANDIRGYGDNTDYTIRYKVEYYIDDGERLETYIYSDSPAECREKVLAEYPSAIITACIPEEVPASYKEFDLGESLSLVDKKVAFSKHGSPVYFTDKQLADAKEKYPELEYEETTVKFPLPKGQKAYLLKNITAESALAKLLGAKRGKIHSNKLSEWFVGEPDSTGKLEGEARHQLYLDSPEFNIAKQYVIDFANECREQGHPVESFNEFRKILKDDGLIADKVLFQIYLDAYNQADINMLENASGMGKYSDKFHSYLSFLENEDAFGDICYLAGQLIRYCKEEDLKDLWLDRMGSVAKKTGFNMDTELQEGFRYKGEDKISEVLEQHHLDELRAEPGKVYNFKRFDIFYGENNGHYPFRPCFYVKYRPSGYTSIFMNDAKLLDYMHKNYFNETFTEGLSASTYDKTNLENDLLAIDDVDKVDWDLSAYNELGEIIVLVHRAFEDSLDMSTYYMQRTKLLREIIEVFNKNNLKLVDPIEDQGTWWYFVLEHKEPVVDTATPNFEYMTVEFFETSDPLTDNIMEKTRGVKYTDPKVLSDLLVRADEAFRSVEDNSGYNKVYFDNFIRYNGKLYKFHAGRVDLGDGAAQVSLPADYTKLVTDYFLDEVNAGNNTIPVVED
jgi:hypothetical protein